MLSFYEGHCKSTLIICVLLLQRGWTPLIMAAKGGYTEVVDCLLERDPHINATDQVLHCSRNVSAPHINRIHAAEINEICKLKDGCVTC